MSRATLQHEQELQMVTTNTLKLEKLIHTLDEQIAEKKKERGALEKRLEANQHKLKVLADLKIIELGLPRSVIIIRKKVVLAYTDLKREDITIARQKFLEVFFKKELAVLKEICPHPFILSYPGYEGDPMHEWENARYGRRKCVICELSENSETTVEEIYKVLVDKEGRLIKDDFRQSEKSWKTRQAPLQPLDYLTEAFRRSAGSKIIRWPVLKEGKVTNECYTI